MDEADTTLLLSCTQSRDWRKASVSHCRPWSKPTGGYWDTKKSTWLGPGEDGVGVREGFLEEVASAPGPEGWVRSEEWRGGSWKWPKNIVGLRWWRREQNIEESGEFQKVIQTCQGTECWRVMGKGWRERSKKGQAEHQAKELAQDPWMCWRKRGALRYINPWRSGVGRD